MTKSKVDKAAEEAAAAEAAAKAAEEAAAAEAAAKAAEEAAAAEAAPQAAEDGADITGKVLSIRASSPTGRRRAGRAFTQEAVEIAADELSEDEIGAILSDPQLSVTVL